jgi:hypothetical protein
VRFEFLTAGLIKIQVFLDFFKPQKWRQEVLQNINNYMPLYMASYPTRNEIFRIKMVKCAIRSVSIEI